MPEIRSDEDAFDLLASVLAGAEVPDGLVLADWPNLNIRLTGDKFHNSLTPSVMKGFVDFQTAIYRSYATAKYGVPDVRKLSVEERSDLELVVEVDDGSSLLGIDVQKLLETFIAQVATKMDPIHVITIALGAGLLWAGKVSYKSYLANRKQIRLAELRTEERKAEIQHVEALSQQETARARILVQAAQREPVLRNIARQAFDAKTDLIKSLASADTIEIEGVDITGAAAKELVTNARRRSSVVQLDGMYRIRRVDLSKPGICSVRIRNLDSRNDLDATVKDAALDNQSRSALQSAEWDRTPIFLAIDARVLDDQVRAATIVSVGAQREVVEEEDDI